MLKSKFGFYFLGLDLSRQEVSRTFVPSASYKSLTLSASGASCGPPSICAAYSWG